MVTLEVIFVAINQLIAQLVAVLPKLIIALFIWYLGRYLLSFSAKMVRKLDVKHTTLDNKAVESIAVVINGFGTVILLLIILDFLGIGSSVVTAIAQGVTYSVAIALGLAFGKALEGDAKKILDDIKRILSPHHSSSDYEEDKGKE